MSRNAWSRLNKQQVGAYAEYFVKMELTMYGFEVYVSDVDDHGIDFIARQRGGSFIEVQVKSLRSMGYVFMRKATFRLQDRLHLALCLLQEGEPPELYLIPSLAWESPTALLVSRDYVGLKSDEEWGINVSKRNKPLLEPYRFDHTIAVLSKEHSGR